MTHEDPVEIARRVAREVLRPGATERDRAGEWFEEGSRALRASGLGGLVVPPSAGGLGHGLLAVAQVCEALGEECASTAIGFGMHLVGSAVLSARATPEQTERYLRPIAAGEHLTTLALSEPGTGSNFYIPEMRAARDGDGWVLSGTKSFVTNGAHADSYVVSAVAEGAGPGEFSCLVLPKDTLGMTWGPPWSGWGMRGNAARTLSLLDARVDAGAILGREGDEIWYVFRVVAPYFLMAMSGTYLGLARAALAEAREHVLRRAHTHLGQALADQPLVQHRIGELWARVERTRALVYDAARKGDQEHPEALLALCAAKAEIADCAERTAADAMTLMGGRAYGSDARIHQLYRDARAAHVMAPTTDQLRIWTGRAFLGVPLLAE